MARKNILGQLSGRQFLELVDQEIKDRNKSIGKTSYAEICAAAGLSQGYLAVLSRADRPNPTALTKRLILHVLGYPIDRPEGDVIPHLIKRGLWTETSLKGDVA
jgi:transcriptional regulator with XRE-family HTH domain